MLRTAWARSPRCVGILVPATARLGPLLYRAQPLRRHFYDPYSLTTLKSSRYLSAVAGPRAPHPEDTIYALSTAPGRAAIAVIRVSGSACVHVYRALCPGTSLPKPRYASVRALYDPTSPPSLDSVLDHSALVIFFSAPRTATGEDMLELHVHGGTAVVRAVLKAISQCGSTDAIVRYAEPGEFTQRAFFNDRLDLTQVEALGDVLGATTEQQRKRSMRGTSRMLAQRYEEWRLSLLHARGELEALIDFSEDQHFDESPVTLLSSVASQVERLKKHIDAHVENAMRGELLRNGISISLLGAPNVGKSSLLNRIVGREVAIVSEEAGTTRDIVEAGIDLGGYLCRFGDMAGLRLESSGLAKNEQVGRIEKEGIKRAKQRALESDIVVVMTEVQYDEHGHIYLPLEADVAEVAARCASRGTRIIAVINKTDLLGPNKKSVHQDILARKLHERLPSIDTDAVVAISCIDTEDDGVRNLQAALISTFESMTAAVSVEDQPDSMSGHESLGASERHRLLLEACSNSLCSFISEVAAAKEHEQENVDIVVAAETLRIAADCLARITGRSMAGDVEEVLGIVFEKFCVGK